MGLSPPFLHGVGFFYLRFFHEDEVYEILKSFHDEPFGGNFVDERIAKKVYHLGYYWPTIFRDAKKYFISCDNG